MTKKITMFVYFLLVIFTFLYTMIQKDLYLNSVNVFFGVLFPCFMYWLIYKWFRKSDRKQNNSWVQGASSLFYYLCFLVGLVVLLKIYLDPSNVAISFMLLPFIQGLVYLVGVAIVAHLFILLKPNNK